MNSELPSHVDVLIVGAGMAGLALASALRDSGLRIGLIEAGSLPAEPPMASGVNAYDPRVSALTSASVSFMRSIDAWSTVEQYRSCRFEAMQVWDARGTAAMGFDATEVGATELGYIVENRISQYAIYCTLRSHPAITFFNPERLVSIESVADRREAQLESGAKVSADLLVAADGGNSVVRQLAGLATRKWSYEQKAIVATVRCELPHEHCAWQRFLPQGPLAFLPLAEADQRHCSIVWSQDTAVAEDLMSLDCVAFSEKLQRAFGDRLGRVEEVSKRFSFPLNQLHATDYISEQLALIGDAAHVIHPLAGQGVNLGFKDVAVLADEILKARHSKIDLGSELCLQRYQRRRKSDNLMMMTAVESLKRLFGAQDLPLAWLRNEGMRQLGKISPLKHQVLRHAMGL